MDIQDFNITKEHLADFITRGTQDQKLVGSNCTRITLVSFTENGKTFHVIVKKSRLDKKYLTLVQGEYESMRHHLGDIIPRQVFFVEEDRENSREMITAICAPVVIAYDIFESDENWHQFMKQLDSSEQLQEDLDMFLVGYRKLQNQGISLDLYGKENLVVTRDGRLRYIDSFIVNLANRKSLASVSEDNFRRLTPLGTI